MRIYSDLKFNEGYANAKLNQITEAIEAFHESHKFSIKSKTYLQKFLNIIVIIVIVICHCKPCPNRQSSVGLI